jgi:hypothetical protein
MTRFSTHRPGEIHVAALPDTPPGFFAARKSAAHGQASPWTSEVQAAPFRNERPDTTICAASDVRVSLRSLPRRSSQKAGLTLDDPRRYGPPGQDPSLLMGSSYRNDPTPFSRNPTAVSYTIKSRGRLTFLSLATCPRGRNGELPRSRGQSHPVEGVNGGVRAVERLQGVRVQSMHGGNDSPPPPFGCWILGFGRHRRART